MIKNLIGQEWYDVIGEEFSKPYMGKLCNFIQDRRTKTTVYPPKEQIFTAYKLTPFNKVKVCIIGQDPYINEGEAHGLAFSTGNGKSTPSLRQIARAVELSMSGDDWDSMQPWNNNLTRWAEQGVFLLNKVLTVDAKKSNSHKGMGWEQFVFRTVQELDKKGDVIFLLWGKEAQILKPILKSTVIECEHPVAASYRGETWNNNDCFYKVNELLETEINW